MGNIPFLVLLPAFCITFQRRLISSMAQRRLRMRVGENLVLCHFFRSVSTSLYLIRVCPLNRSARWFHSVVEQIVVKINGINRTYIRLCMAEHEYDSIPSMLGSKSHAYPCHKPHTFIAIFFAFHTNPPSNLHNSTLNRWRSPSLTPTFPHDSNLGRQSPCLTLHTVLNAVESRSRL